MANEMVESQEDVEWGNVQYPVSAAYFWQRAFLPRTMPSAAIGPRTAPVMPAGY